MAFTNIYNFDNDYNKLCKPLQKEDINMLLFIGNNYLNNDCKNQSGKIWGKYNENTIKPDPSQTILVKLGNSNGLQLGDYAILPDSEKPYIGENISSGMNLIQIKNPDINLFCLKDAKELKEELNKIKEIVKDNNLRILNKFILVLNKYDDERLKRFAFFLCFIKTKIDCKVMEFEKVFNWELRFQSWDSETELANFSVPSIHLQLTLKINCSFLTNLEIKDDILKNTIKNGLKEYTFLMKDMIKKFGEKGYFNKFYSVKNILEQLE